jgi:hypothetical protein
MFECDKTEISPGDRVRYVGNCTIVRAQFASTFLYVYKVNNGYCNCEYQDASRISHAEQRFTARTVKEKSRIVNNSGLREEDLSRSGFALTRWFRLGEIEKCKD